MARIFVAVPVAAAVRTKLGRIPREHPGSWRWVAEHLYHITLKFLGEVPSAQIADVEQALQKAAANAVTGWVSEAVGTRWNFSPIRLAVHGAGGFPDVRRARVLWAGVGGERDKLFALHRNVEAQLAAVGFPPERRRFRPHITLARARGAGGPLPPGLRAAEFAAKPAEAGGGDGESKGGTSYRWSVRGMQLVESRLSPRGPRYVVRREIWFPDVQREIRSPGDGLSGG